MTIDPANLAAPGVRTLAPYIPGKPIEELEREYGIRDSIKLASKENPLGPGPRSLSAIAEAARQIGLYPDGSGFALKRALARKHGCSIDCITLGNGSNDVLVIIAEAFLTLESEAVYSQYTFAVYPIAVQATGAIARVAAANPAGHAMPLGHDLAALAQLVNDRTRLVFVANPNNPTGTWLEAQALQRFIAELPQQTLVVVDEAYIEYVSEPGFADASAWLNEFPNLIVTRTFSKAYGLAGLRVGYSLSHPAIAGMLNRVRQPFNVNSVALAAALAALDDAEHLQRSVEVNRSGMAQLKAGFDALGVRHLPSAGNFVLIDCARPAAPLYEAMLRQGVIVRPVGNYQLPNHLRITIGTPEQNERMLAALRQALAAVRSTPA
jgi:histidinol-phosphate aminotransferase